MPWPRGVQSRAPSPVGSCAQGWRCGRGRAPPTVRCAPCPHCTRSWRSHQPTPHPLQADRQHPRLQQTLKGPKDCSQQWQLAQPSAASMSICAQTGGALLSGESCQPCKGVCSASRGDRLYKSCKCTETVSSCASQQARLPAVKGCAAPGEIIAPTGAPDWDREPAPGVLVQAAPLLCRPRLGCSLRAVLPSTTTLTMLSSSCSSQIAGSECAWCWPAGTACRQLCLTANWRMLCSSCSRQSEH